MQCIIDICANFFWIFLAQKMAYMENPIFQKMSFWTWWKGSETRGLVKRPKRPGQEALTNLFHLFREIKISQFFLRDQKIKMNSRNLTKKNSNYIRVLQETFQIQRNWEKSLVSKELKRLNSLGQIEARAIKTKIGNKQLYKLLVHSGTYSILCIA